MYLVYLDESGNTGTDLGDAQQPLFVLGALIVPEDCWQNLESDLESSLAARFPDLAQQAAEVHAADVRAGRRVFKGVSVAERISLRDDWLKVSRSHALKFVYRAIGKKNFQKWVHQTFGTGVSINPYIAAFPLVALVVNEYLSRQGALGIIISDENKEIVKDIEKSIKQLRLTSGPLKLSQVIEKGFFIDSAKSRILQLSDLCVLNARKKEEVKTGGQCKEYDKNGIELLDALIHKGNEQF